MSSTFSADIFLDYLKKSKIADAKAYFEKNKKGVTSLLLDEEILKNEQVCTTIKDILKQNPTIRNLEVKVKSLAKDIQDKSLAKDLRDKLVQIVEGCEPRYIKPIADGLFGDKLEGITKSALKSTLKDAVKYLQSHHKKLKETATGEKTNAESRHKWNIARVVTIGLIIAGGIVAACLLLFSPITAVSAVAVIPVIAAWLGFKTNPEDTTAKDAADAKLNKSTEKENAGEAVLQELEREGGDLNKAITFYKENAPITLATDGAKKVELDKVIESAKAELERLTTGAYIPAPIEITTIEQPSGTVNADGVVVAPETRVSVSF